MFVENDECRIPADSYFFPARVIILMDKAEGNQRMSKHYTRDELNSQSKDSLVTTILAMQDTIDRLSADTNRLIEQIAIANNKKYGRSSEKKDVIDGQMSIWDYPEFNEAEALLEQCGPVEEPAEEEVIVVKRKKAKGKREEDLKDLPTEVLRHSISEEKLLERFGTDGWYRLPDEVYKRVRIVPAQYIAEEHHVEVYVGKKTKEIIKADRPKDLLRNSVATPSAVATIMNAKYVNGLPLYRIEQEFQRNSVQLLRPTMSNWVIRCAERYLWPLYDRLHKEIYRFHVLGADETPVMVSKDDRPANSRSYMWIYRTGKAYSDTPIILYEYQKTRKADHPKEFLNGFEGVVICDGYSAYRKLDKDETKITFAGCWAHAKRYFADALKAIPKAKKDSAKSTIAYKASSRISYIYHQDNEIFRKEKDPKEQLKLRRLRIKPLVEDFFAWAKKIQQGHALPNGKTLEGINYCINQEAALKVFLDDVEVPLDNNATEGALRSFCVHKHAWKLIDTVHGANASAVIYSITETSKANRLNPYRYLEYILTVMKDRQDDTNYDFIDDLLPWSETLPEICRSKSQK